MEYEASTAASANMQPVEGTFNDTINDIKPIANATTEQSAKNEPLADSPTVKGAINDSSAIANTTNEKSALTQVLADAPSEEVVINDSSPIADARVNRVHIICCTNRRIQ